MALARLACVGASFFSFVLLSFFVVVVAEERMIGSKLAKFLDAT